MEQKELQKLLLETVICSIACDGDIDDREIAELHKMIDNAPYFKGLKVDDFLDDMLQSVKSDGRAFLRNYFDQLKKSELSPLQELLVLEVVLRIIHADERLDNNEITFLKLVRTNFNVHDEIIHQRFGDVPCLAGSSKEEYHLGGGQQEDMDALAVKIAGVADLKTGLDGLFDEKVVKSDITTN